MLEIDIQVMSTKEGLAAETAEPAIEMQRRIVKQRRMRVKIL